MIIQSNGQGKKTNDDRNLQEMPKEVVQMHIHKGGLPFFSTISCSNGGITELKDATYQYTPSDLPKTFCRWIQRPFVDAKDGSSGISTLRYTEDLFSLD